jgi:hypothetical protein
MKFITSLLLLVSAVANAETTALEQFLFDIKTTNTNFDLFVDDDVNDDIWVLPPGLEGALQSNDLQVSLRSQQCVPVLASEAFAGILNSLSIQYDDSSKSFLKAKAEFTKLLPSDGHNELCFIEENFRGYFCGLGGRYAYIMNLWQNDPIVAIATTEDIFWCE